MLNEDLARRVVACKHWRWMAPMPLIDLFERRAVLLWHDSDVPFVEGSPFAPIAVYVHEDDEVEYIQPIAMGHDWFPDLDDPATLGCLLALVRKAWGMNWLHVQCLPHLWRSRWAVVGDCSTRPRHDGAPAAWARSEVEALVLALEGAP